MTMTMTRGRESTLVGPRLLVAFELSERTWKLGFTIGREQRPRLRTIPAGAVDRLLEEVRRAKVRFGLPPEAPVISCYEAGREGFWLHRWAVAQGWTNYVVDSSSTLHVMSRLGERIILRPTAEGRALQSIPSPLAAPPDPGPLARLPSTNTPAAIGCR